MKIYEEAGLTKEEFIALNHMVAMSPERYKHMKMKEIENDSKIAFLQQKVNTLEQVVDHQNHLIDQLEKLLNGFMPL